MPTKAKNPIPEGMNTLTLYLTYKGKCSEAIDFYKNTFGAVSLFPPMLAPDKRIMHAMLKIGDTNIMLSDSFGEENATVGNMATIWMYVADCDAVFNTAVKNGCKVKMALEDQFWGDRTGQVQDPFGYYWTIASNKLDLSTDEMIARQNEWLKGFK
jgi:uncharacterized glyoxalase superfamily protein PhnB